MLGSPPPACSPPFSLFSDLYARQECLTEAFLGRIVNETLKGMYAQNQAPLLLLLSDLFLPFFGMAYL